MNRRATPRHLDYFGKLTPDALEKLRLLMRTRGLDMTARLLHTSSVTIESVSSPFGGARRDTIERLEKTLKEYPIEMGNSA